MKAVAVLGLVAGAFAVTDLEHFAAFKTKFGKTYGSKIEERSRFAVFQENLRKAEALNAKSESATFGVTKFSDLTSEEFHYFYANLNSTDMAAWHKTLPKARIARATAGQDVNWVTGTGSANGLIVVSSVKDQEQCGSCWTFSAAAAFEGCQMKINADNNDVDVSTQQFVDCCTAGGSDGCNGGYPNLAIKWGTSTDLATWDSYPYTAVAGDCETVGTVAVSSGTCGFQAVGTDESDAQSALQTAPVSIALDATVLQTYTGGIITDCDYSSIDHAVFLVAQDTSSSAYTVKNSWGADWGESGYFRMQTDVNCLSFNTMSSQAIPN